VRWPGLRQTRGDGSSDICPDPWCHIPGGRRCTLPRTPARAANETAGLGQSQASACLRPEAAGRSLIDARPSADLQRPVHAIEPGARLAPGTPGFGCAQVEAAFRHVVRDLAVDAFGVLAPGGQDIR